MFFFVRPLPKEGNRQAEIYYLFQELVMSNMTYRLFVYVASNAEHF